MSLFILDTDMLTLFEEGHSLVLAKVQVHPSDQLAITVLSVEEQLSGWYTALRRAKRPDKLAWAYARLANTVRFLSRLQVLTYTEKDMQRYEQLHNRRPRIGKMDLRIAAIVLNHDGTLVTRNRRDFQRVPGLQLEDWSQ